MTVEEAEALIGRRVRLNMRNGETLTGTVYEVYLHYIQFADSGKFYDVAAVESVERL